MMQATIGDAQARHHGLRAGDRAALPVLLGGDARVRARRVDERDQREAVPVGELHHPHRLSVALGMGHAEVALRPLLDVAALLVADQGDRAAVEAAEAGDERLVVGAAAVAVQLDEVLAACARRSRACTAGSGWRASSTERQICSSLGSATMRSSCRCRRSSSPDRRAPRRSGRLRSRFSRSRSWTSASPGIAEEPQEAGDVGPELGPRDDRVEVSEAVGWTRRARSRREASLWSSAGRPAAR